MTIHQIITFPSTSLYIDCYYYWLLIFDNKSKILFPPLVIIIIIIIFLAVVACVCVFVFVCVLIFIWSEYNI